MIDYHEEIIKHREEMIDYHEEIIKHHEEMIDYHEEIIKHREEMIDYHEEIINYESVKYFAESVHFFVYKTMWDHMKADKEALSSLRARKAHDATSRTKGWSRPPFGIRRLRTEVLKLSLIHPGF